MVDRLFSAGKSMNLLHEHALGCCCYCIPAEFHAGDARGGGGSAAASNGQKGRTQSARIRNADAHFSLRRGVLYAGDAALAASAAALQRQTRYPGAQKRRYTTESARERKRKYEGKWIRSLECKVQTSAECA
ncbi:uncharacterized protein LOC107980810 isoform X2 [Nasonia vitripennis]|uniref:Uncharacterized protein n=1 Tax=Nasonia vitripennis TaxID=7425 RepID=A0A7M7Q4D9_NASVI|nr:uncharacterized protein LOC107980810 isoform X2 [Nasonia vitripennis]XP_031781477.1 uncharacterized protein LOC107980810 isoform X2 [Nasonia vitripennis]XP_031781480.1 uncharacterized protein LOC107980810 isoform X2 [Nasonia vitripennis]